MHFGFKEEETDVNVFGAEALARMGCNPFNKNDVIPSSKLTPKKTQSDASSVEGTPTRLGKRTLKPTNLGEKTKKGKTEETIELEFSDSD